MVRSMVPSAGGGVGRGGDAAHVIAGKEDVVDGRAGCAQAGQGRAGPQPVVVVEQAEQVQARQVRDAGACLDGASGGFLACGPQARGEVGRGQDAGGPVQQDGSVGPPGEPGDVGHAGGAALHVADDLPVGRRVRPLFLQRHAEGVLIAGIDPQPGAGAVLGFLLQVGNRGGDVVRERGDRLRR